MITIAVANQKGGVGKTTLTLNVAQLLATRHGRRVLTVDLDFQTNLTQVWTVEPQPDRTIAEVLTGRTAKDERVKVTVADIVVPVANHFLAPGSPLMNSLDIRLGKEPYREERLKRALQAVAAEYDYVLFDCPPALTLPCYNALIAATHVLIPTIPETLPIKSTQDFLSNLAEFRRDWHPELQLLGIVPNHCEQRTAHHEGGLEFLRQLGGQWGVEVLPEIAHTTRVRDAANNVMALVDYESQLKGHFSSAAEAMEAIADKIDNVCMAQASAA